MTYDIVIIGGGPGGLTAAIYASRSKLKTLILEKGVIGGQAATTSELENYPGFFDGTSGPDVTNKMRDHALHYGAEIKADEVREIKADGDLKKIVCKDGEYIAKSVIIATGAEPKTLGVPGEAEFRGKGISYCATCDAEFCEELEIVVVGSGNTAIEEAHYLTKFADKVTIAVMHDEGVLDAQQIAIDTAYANPKIEFVWNTVVEEIYGDGLIEGVKFKNVKTGEVTDFETSMVFIFIGTTPITSFLGDYIELDEWGYIPTTDLMETSVPGVFAIGDVRQKFLRQVVTATADGAIGAVAAEKFIEKLERK